MVVFVADPVFRYTADSTVPTIERNVEVEVADSGTLGRIDLNRNDVGVSGTALRVLDTFLDNSCTIDFLNSNDSALVRGGVSIMARRKQGRMQLQPGDALVLPAHPKFHVLGVTSYSLSVKEGVVARVETPPATEEGVVVTITLNTPSTDDGQSPRLVFQPEERSSDDDIYDKGGSTLPPPSVRHRVVREDSSSDEERMVAVQAVVALACESKKLTRRFKREMAESDRVVPPLSERSRRRGDEALQSDDDNCSEDDEKPNDEDKAFVEDDLTNDSKPVVKVLLESVHGSLTTAKAIRQHQLIADANTHLVPEELTRLMDVFSGKGLLEPLEHLERKKHADDGALARIRDAKRNFYENKAVDDLAREGGDFYSTYRGQVEKHGVYFQRRVDAALETKAEVLKQLEAAREAHVARAQPEVVEDSQEVVAPSHKAVGGKRSWRALAVPDDTFYSREDPRKRRS